MTGKRSGIAVATIQQIAEEAGVSIPTVRHILGNRADSYRPATCERVIRVAHKMGYRPHSSARAMSTGSFDCIALLLSIREHRSTLPIGLLEGIHDGLAERNLHLNLARVPDEELMDERSVPKFLREWMVDGMIINYTHDFPTRLQDLIEENELPCVWTNNKLDFDCVRPDDRGIAETAVEYLLGLGHRRIAYLTFGVPTDQHGQICPNPNEHYSTMDRYLGCAERLRESGHGRLLGLPNIEKRLPKMFPTSEKIAMTARWLSGLSAAERPTAVVTYGDSEVFPLLAATRILGIRVPEDLSIVTFSTNLEFAEDVETGTPFTTFLLPQYGMGRETVEMLLQKIKEPSIPIPYRALPGELRVGGTCATAPTLGR